MFSDDGFTESENIRLKEEVESLKGEISALNSNGEKFPSAAIAAELVGVSRHCIYQACRQGHRTTGLYWRSDGQEA